MSTDAWLELGRCYLESNLLLALGALLLWVGQKIEARPGARMPARAWLRASQALLVAAVVLPAVMTVVPREALWRPAAQVWSGVAPVSRGGGLEAGIAPLGADNTGAGQGLRVGARGLSWAGTLLLLGIASSLARLAWQVGRLRSMLSGLPSIRRMGRVRLVAGPATSVPFSARLGAAWVVVPEGLLANAGDYHIAVRHELQHHRQGDTWWVFVIEGVKALCFWNPAVYAWARLTTSLQEFACDDALLGRRRVPPQAYGRCLLRTAQSALGHRSQLVGTAGMATGRSSTLLKRRIEMMMNRGDRPAGRWRLVVWALCALGMLSTSAYASRSALQNGKLTLEEARALAAPRQADGSGGKGGSSQSASSELPLVVNQQVLDRLNEFLGTPKGRAFIQGGLERMPEYRATVERKLTERKLPLELLALPLIESGYKNMSARNNGASYAPGMRGAGIWMFIPQTAVRFGLKVDNEKGIDERLDVEKETDAAIAYLEALHTRFKDWSLAVAAYNMGEKAVEAAIAEGGSRDAWQLSRDGKLNDYLATVMAGMILMQNPEVVE